VKEKELEIMKIRRFYAKGLRDALRQVKEELGSDAVILSNNKVEGGVELVAAIDYDESKIQESIADKIPPSPMLKKTELETALDNPATFSRNHKAKPEPSPKWMESLKQRQSDNLARLNKDDVLKEDVVSFSQARKIRKSKKEPHISEGRVNSVLDKADFSDLLAKTAIASTNEPEESEINPFDYEALLMEKNKKRFNDRQISASSKSNTYDKPQRKKVKQTEHQAKVEWSQDPMLVSMKEEIQALKDMLQSQMSGLAWGNFNRNNPHRAELLQRLCKLGLRPSICETILRQLSEKDSLEEAWKKSLAIIAKGVNVAEEDIINQGGKIALVGPTGVGKTTSIAKLAARFTLRYDAEELALVSTDSFRIGAQEQLKTYGQLLRVPVYIASNEKELASILKRLEDKRLVLIDTAGMNQRDIRMTEQLAMLKNAHTDVKLLAVLSASAQSSAVSEVVEVFNSYGLDGCIVSKLDESTSLGGILSVILEHQLTLHYVTDGQKVPEDIHPGRVNQLLKTAMGIVREYKDAYDYSDIAMSFAGELLHANG